MARFGEILVPDGYQDGAYDKDLAARMFLFLAWSWRIQYCAALLCSEVYLGDIKSFVVMIQRLIFCRVRTDS